MKYLNNIKNNKAFTLVELLIVVVIIGILSGVVVTIINPITQQNRARDAVTVASINKMVLSTEAYSSAYIESPVASEFLSGLTNAKPMSNSECSDNTCLFSLDASPLPETCSSNYYGNGENQCYFFYEKVKDSTDFYIYAKSFGTDSLYVYRSTGDGKKLQMCPNKYPVPESDDCVDM